MLSPLVKLPSLQTLTLTLTLEHHLTSLFALGRSTFSAPMMIMAPTSKLPSDAPDDEEPSYPLKFPNLTSIVIYCDQLIQFDGPEQYLEKVRDQRK
jgi:hypothetical protein